MLQLASGSTPIINFPDLNNYFGLTNLFIKDESKNPFGTWKDRRSASIAKQAQDERIDTLCLITYGNAGYSLGQFAKTTHVDVVAIIDKNLNVSIKDALAQVCTLLISIDLSKRVLKPNEVVDLVRDNENENIWEVSNGFSSSYESIVQEILAYVPDYLVCPVGSGEAFIGLSDGLAKAKLQTRLVGVVPRSGTQLADKLSNSWSPYHEEIRFLLTKGHQLIQADDAEILDAYRLARNYLDCEPSAAIIFGALPKIDFRKTDRIIAINTGKGLFAPVEF